MKTARHTYSSPHYQDDSAGKEIIYDLVFINYAHNRDLAPDISPERWSRIYGDTTAMEARYQRELRLAAFDKAYAAWDADLYAAFPNAHLLCPGYDADYPRMQEWKKANPAPRQPLCRHCGEDYRQDEARWCCNKNCSHYLT